MPEGAASCFRRSGGYRAARAPQGVRLRPWRWPRGSSGTGARPASRLAPGEAGQDFDQAPGGERSAVVLVVVRRPELVEVEAADSLAVVEDLLQRAEDLARTEAARLRVLLRR